MIKRSEVKAAQIKAAELLNNLGIELTADERANIEVAESGMDE